MNVSTKNKNSKSHKSNNANTYFSNKELVTIAIFLLGGDSKYVDTEDIAVKVNDLAPGRFKWRKYPDQINIDNVRKRLSDAKDPKKGGYILGSFKQGWILSEVGLKFSQKRIKDLDSVNLERIPLTRKEMVWRNREKTRMLASGAYEKFTSNNIESITSQEAKAFFRIDDYIMGKARERRLALIINSFREDPDLGKLIKNLAKKVKKSE